MAEARCKHRLPADQCAFCRPPARPTMSDVDPWGHRRPNRRNRRAGCGGQRPIPRPDPSPASQSDRPPAPPAHPETPPPASPAATTWLLYQRIGLGAVGREPSRRRGPSPAVPAEFRIYRSSRATLHITRTAADQGNLQSGLAYVLLVDRKTGRVALRPAHADEGGWRMAIGPSGVGAVSLSVGTLLSNLGVAPGAYPLEWIEVDGERLPGFRFDVTGEALMEASTR